MFDKIFSTIGGFLGDSLGGGILSTIGRFAGKALGEYIKDLNYEPTESYSFKNIKDSFSFSKARQGDIIPLTFGRMKVRGAIIWAGRIGAREKITERNKYFSGSDKVKSINYLNEPEYFLSFALALCEGPIVEIGKVWIGENLIDIGKYKYRLYEGTEEQKQDPIFTEAGNKAPAYRGLAYIIFEDLPLADFGNTVPPLYFEVIRKPSVKAGEKSVEEKVRAVNIIPGSGEYVYDTLPQYKIIKDILGAEIFREPINYHNNKKISNSVLSLNQLQNICPNLEWVSLVLCWFGDDLDAKFCRIRPAVEFNDSSVSYTEEWNVAGYDRKSAYVISKEKDGSPRYGGSVNDASVKRYLAEIKKRGLKLMVYPMFLMDLEKKPWRGRLTGAPESIAEFFNKKEGYAEFIIHYANLAKEYADAFVIGSELIGLTKVRDSSNNFPAVGELVKLAEKVKKILNPGTSVTYAADWSEYHHTEGGWYNMDPLFSSPHIDFIGIDAYFPVTKSLGSDIKEEDIIKGFACGEGYDFYYGAGGKKEPLEPKYAWKNLKFWLENEHRNPDGKLTEWVPGSKEVWFTEFGFPSIDKATNRPNVFFDPKCLDGGIPDYSSGGTDFSIQRRAVKAFLEYWLSSGYVKKAFLWTWDARPYPAWPHTEIWADRGLWEKGHWINDKFGIAPLCGILAEISQRSGVSPANLEFVDLDESVQGIIFDKGLRSLDYINILRSVYFFDIVSGEGGKISFVKRAAKRPYEISSGDFLKLFENAYERKSYLDSSKIISAVSLYFLDRNNDYSQNYFYLSKGGDPSVTKTLLKLPIVLTESEAKNLSVSILENAAGEKASLKFALPYGLGAEFEPGDFALASCGNFKSLIRIISLKYIDRKIEITAILDETSSYYLPARAESSGTSGPEIESSPDFAVTEDFLPESGAKIYIYRSGSADSFIYASVNGDSRVDYFKISSSGKTTALGKILSFSLYGKASVFLRDTISKFTLYAPGLEKFLEGGSYRAKLGEEFISFGEFKNLGKGLYEISLLSRGENFTENYINSQKAGDLFLLLKNPESFEISENLENRELFFKLGEKSIPKKFIFKNLSQKTPPPFIKYQNFSQGILSLRFEPRSLDPWPEEKKYKYSVEIKSGQFIHKVDTAEKDLKIKLPKEFTEGGEIKIEITPGVELN